MFSSKQLISYVFANPDDEYRDNDLMTWNLPQYLWKNLHQDSFAPVYFLRKSADGCFTVHTFGDQNAEPYKPSFFGSAKKKFGEWLLKQLCLQKQRAAFVCSLNDFCDILSHPDWHPLLADIAGLPQTRRTGIFVLTASPYAEDSREALLRPDSVFDHLGETAVTGSRGTNRCIYSDLRDKKPGHYLCLNAYTPERIDALLLHLSLRHPERCMLPEERQAIAANLAAHLQRGLFQPGGAADSMPVPYLTYHELYQQLDHPEVWKQAMELSPRLRPTETVPILRKPECYAGRCLNLHLPAWVQDQRDSTDRCPEDILKTIREIVSLPSNGKENPQLLENAGELMCRLNNLNDGDIDTCSLLLDALKFCAERIMVNEKDANYQIILDASEVYIQCFEESCRIFLRDKYLTALAHDPLAAGIERLRLPDYWKELEKDRHTLNACLGYLPTNIRLLETSGNNDLRKMYYEQIRTFEFLGNQA